jgi:hypothetical protein
MPPSRTTIGALDANFRIGSDMPFAIAAATSTLTNEIAPPNSRASRTVLLTCASRQRATEALRPLTEQQEKLVAQVARERGVDFASLRAILNKLGEAGFRDEDISKRLDATADELIKLREEIAKVRQGPPEFAVYADQAQALINKGDIEGARDALRPVLTIDSGMHTARIMNAAVNKEAHFAVTGFLDKTVRVWSLPDGHLFKTIRLPAGEGNIGQVYAVAMSPDDNLIAAGGWTTEASDKGSIYLFDRTTGQMTERIRGLPDVVTKLEFYPTVPR